MTIVGNSYTVEEINRAAERTASTLAKFAEGSVNPSTIQFLMELYLGAVDANKPQTKTVSAS